MRMFEIIMESMHRRFGDTDAHILCDISDTSVGVGTDFAGIIGKAMSIFTLGI